ncbi:MAG: hypothetical protein EOM24_17875, partial [Chloroflexia bacterium]|nr:hypothetical protein [Chloroflexia bacterium]
MTTIDVITIDYETYWSAKYSLSKLNAIEYIMGDEFELISCATKINDQQTIVTFGMEATLDLFAEIDWPRAVVVAHNGAEFDHLVTAWRVSPRLDTPIQPRLWADTLQMARPIHQRSVGGSLKTLAEQYGLQAKGDLTTGVLGSTKGVHLRDFTPEQLVAMREYNQVDTELCYALFQRMLPHTSAEELLLMDMTTRALAHPQFHLNIDLLKRGLKAEQRRKERSLDALAERLGYRDLADDLGELVEQGRE